VALLFRIEIGIIAILVGWMVAQSDPVTPRTGWAGVRNKYLAVTLTLLRHKHQLRSVAIYQYMKSPKAQEQLKKQQPEAGNRSRRPKAAPGPLDGCRSLPHRLLFLARSSIPRAAGSFVSGLISLFITLYRDATRLANDRTQPTFCSPALRGRRAMNCPACAAELHPAALSCPPVPLLDPLRRTGRPVQTRDMPHGESVTSPLSATVVESLTLLPRNTVQHRTSPRASPRSTLTTRRSPTLLPAIGARKISWA
jgi:hypothetical protein